MNKAELRGQIVPSRRKKRSRTHLKPEDFGRLDPLSSTKLEELFEHFRIRHSAKSNLEGIIAGMNGLMDEERKEPTRRDDRARIEKMRREILHSISKLRSLRGDGKRAIQAGAKPIADMLSIDWFRYRFPNDEWPPKRNGQLRENMRQPIREPLRGRGTDQGETDRKYWFVQNRTTETLLAVFQEIDAALSCASMTLKSAGGREVLSYRNIFLANLAIFWHAIGKKVSGGPTQSLLIFVCMWRTPSAGLQKV